MLFVNLEIAKNKPKPIYWSAKIGGFLSLIFLTGCSYLFVNIFYIVISIYYLKNATIEFFNIKNNYKILYFCVGLIGAFLIAYLDFEFKLIHY